MKNIAAQMVNFDCEQMRRIANNMPEQYDEKPQVCDFHHQVRCLATH
ncbi:replication protein P of bacteriophage [Escherichia coli]|nr:replication protein P of bacteriophage [Escherichia coli]